MRIDREPQHAVTVSAAFPTPLLKNCVSQGNWKAEVAPTPPDSCCKSDVINMTMMHMAITLYT